MNMSRPDGRVDPNCQTITKLNEAISSCNSKNVIQMSNRGINFLKSIEICKLKPYSDQTGKKIVSWCQGATIGYGHLVLRGEWIKYKSGITIKQAEALFIQDLLPYIKMVASNVKPHISQNQFDALVILAFNIGINYFNTSSVLKLINNPSTKTPYSSLEIAWMAWNKSQGKLNRGLSNRRKSEWDIYSKNIYQRW
jgi:GH24 family phage-related lysozyme (muramidase)